MTVSVLRNKAQYTGNGSSTQFEITFAYTETSQIKVYLDGSLQTLTTHYTITDPGQTGTVTFVTAPESGVVISLIRETDYLQTVDYANNDILDAETLESAFDKLTMMCQQLKSLIDGSVGFDETVSDAETTSLKLAAGITDLAGKLLAFDATGNFVTTQEIGTWKGDYSVSTAYVVRDIVKDPSTDNVYFTKRNAPVGTSLSNTTYFALLVDVETVRTLKEAAELAESNAETAQTAAEAALASFQGQYKVGATNPYSGTPDAGDLWYDTTNSILKYYVSGTGFEPVTTSLATVTDNYLTVSNQVITAGTVPISLGGTGATTASTARIALLPTLGTAGQVLAVNTGTTDVEWVDPVTGAGSGTVTSVAISGTDGIEVDSGSPITSSGTIALGINAATLSSHLSLGTAATTASTDYATATQGSTADSAVQPGDNANTLGSGAATDGYVLTADGSGGAAWEAVSAGGGTDVTLAGSLDYITISGQEITRNAIDLTTDVTGTLPVANGGTGVTALSSLDAADLGSSTATDGYVLTADGAGGAAWEAASGGGGGTTAYVEHSDTISDSFTISSGTNRMYIGGTTFSGTITVAGRLAIVAGPANFTGTINVTGTLATV